MTDEEMKDERTRDFSRQAVELFVGITRLAEIWGGNYIIRSIKLIEFLTLTKLKYSFVVFDGEKEIETQAIIDISLDAFYDRKQAEIVQ